VRTDWLQACFDGARSCFDPYQNVVGPRNAAALGLAWRAPIGASGTSSPVYANGRVFVGTANGVVGLNPATGAIIINYRSGPVSTGLAAIKGFDPQPDPPGRVIFGSRDGILHAVSTSGAQLWRARLGAPPASPLVIQGTGKLPAKIIVGAGRAVAAFSVRGRRLWARVLGAGHITKPPAVQQNPPPDPDRVIVAARNTLYAVNPANGAVLWTSVPSRAPLGAPMISTAGAAGARVLVGDALGTLFSIDPATGAVRSTFRAAGPIVGSPAAGTVGRTGRSVFLGDRTGDIYAIDSTDEFPPPEWQAALGGPVDGPPVLANGIVYAATDPEINPGIFALDALSGRTLFRGALPAGAASSPILADGRVILTTKSGDVVAYEGPDS